MAVRSQCYYLNDETSRESKLERVIDDYGFGYELEGQVRDKYYKSRKGLHDLLREYNNTFRSLESRIQILESKILEGNQ